MGEGVVAQAVFLTLVRSARDIACAKMLVDSIRSFGGDLGRCEIWLLDADPTRETFTSFECPGVRVLSLSVPDRVAHYYFADKVHACARAEELVDGRSQSLIWVAPACLIIRPPMLFHLGRSADAAVRPVHIRNVGLSPTEPLDGFWEKVYETVGVQDVQIAVESFVDGQQIRAYYNSHAFSVDPSAGLLRRWFECFEALVCDKEYQANSCQDEDHRVFLHQAVLSALLAPSLEPERLRVLPPDQN